MQNDLNPTHMLVCTQTIAGWHFEGVTYAFYTSNYLDDCEGYVFTDDGEEHYICLPGSVMDQSFTDFRSGDYFKITEVLNG